MSRRAHTHPTPTCCWGLCCIQNQTIPNPTKWDKTGIVIKVRQFDQYDVRVDGSGCVTLRNRKFLLKYLPVIPRAPLAMAPGPTAIALPQVNSPTSITPQHDSFSSPSTPVGPPKTPPCVYQASPPDPTNPLPDSLHHKLQLAQQCLSLTSHHNHLQPTNQPKPSHGPCAISCLTMRQVRKSGLPWASQCHPLQPLRQAHWHLQFTAQPERRRLPSMMN
ncbi:hypothetical protein Pcinc_003638 [Petrolisthes cinctipes]|uniref:Uncharacterized protein n=1 Tax=Petrolisthes cinctipes TaxID=88211 RepID=A0AAE1GFZ3_PETCI|nr:hypothetical protein Pcinc_003638 [Petrolisthes cinctipes]